MDEHELKVKYRTIKLSNLRSGKGKYAHKYVADVVCKCGHKFACATSDLWQRFCPRCAKKINRSRKGK